MHTKFQASALVFALSALLWGCGSSNDPKSVAQDYWDAMAARDIEAVREHATKASASSLSIKEDDDGGDITRVSFGEQTEEGGVVRIPTTVYSMLEGGNEQGLPMQTVLVQEDGEWKVDAMQTMYSAFGGAMGQAAEAMGKALQQGMEEMARGMKEGFGNLGKTE